MTRIGWLVDDGGTVGGAELTQDEFRKAAPEGVEIVDCQPGEVDESCDRYVIHNCVTYTEADLEQITGKPTTKFWHDVGPWLEPGVKEWLYAHADAVCCSPLQADYMGLQDAKLIPPPVDLDRFAQAGAKMNGGRKGAVCVGSWRNIGKAPHKAAQWGETNGGLDFYGDGPFAPPGSVDVPYDRMPELLARYERFVFLPTVIEPFGRIVAEAWSAGCEIVTNGLVGAGYWIENDPEAIDTAAEDFWQAALA